MYFQHTTGSYMFRLLLAPFFTGLIYEPLLFRYLPLYMHLHKENQGKRLFTCILVLSSIAMHLLTHRVTFPDDVDRDLKDILQLMLEKNPDTRAQFTELLVWRGVCMYVCRVILHFVDVRQVFPGGNIWSRKRKGEGIEVQGRVSKLNFS